MKTTAEFGQLLANRRKELGLKQKELAASAGVPNASLSRLENGRLPEFGIRSEINMYVSKDSAQVTGAVQRELVRIG